MQRMESKNINCDCITYFDIDHNVIEQQLQIKEKKWFEVVLCTHV